MNMQELAKKVAGLESQIATLTELVEELGKKNSGSTVRDRGPESTRDMTEDDARRVLLGDLASQSHRKAAEALGLSYGQVYSARGGYTFKGVYKEAQQAKQGSTVENRTSSPQ